MVQRMLLTMNYKWGHLNTWRWPYNMMFEISQSEHLWLSFSKRYVRCIKTVFTNLQYQNCTGEYTTPGMLWGLPHQIEIEKSKVFNRLYVVEKCFENKQEAVEDMNGFSIKPDPVYNEIINDIFGDG